MELKDFEEFKKLSEYCKKAGIESIKLGSLELKFIPQALLPKTAYQIKKESEETKKSLQTSESNSIIEAERILNWSSSIPDMEAN